MRQTVWRMRQRVHGSQGVEMCLVQESESNHKGFARQQKGPPYTARRLGAAKVALRGSSGRGDNRWRSSDVRIETVCKESTHGL